MNRCNGTNNRLTDIHGEMRNARALARELASRLWVEDPKGTTPKSAALRATYDAVMAATGGLRMTDAEYQTAISMLDLARRGR